MNNNLKLVAAVATVATVNYVTRFKFNRKTQTLAHHNQQLVEISELLMQQNEVLVKELDNRTKVNGFLLHQNEYMSDLLDRHDVPITEFDRIAMIYPMEIEE